MLRLEFNINTLQKSKDFLTCKSELLFGNPKKCSDNFPNCFYFNVKSGDNSEEKYKFPNVNNERPFTSL